MLPVDTGTPTVWPGPDYHKHSVQLSARYIQHLNCAIHGCMLGSRFPQQWLCRVRWHAPAKALSAPNLQ